MEQSSRLVSAHLAVCDSAVRFMLLPDGDASVRSLV